MLQTVTEPDQSARVSKTTKLRAIDKLWIITFIVATALPLTFNFSGAYLNAHRIMMLALIVPLTFRLLSGKAPGGILLPDILFFLSVIWVFIALLANHPLGEISIFWLSQATETIGPYLLARLVIRDRTSFIFFIRSFC